MPNTPKETNNISSNNGNNNLILLLVIITLIFSVVSALYITPEITYNKLLKEEQRKA
jgi:hypothetical protein